MNYKEGYIDGYRQAREDITEALRKLVDELDEGYSLLIDDLADKLESGNL